MLSTRKRNLKACFCPLCKGLFRDHRTVKRHQAAFEDERRGQMLENHRGTTRAANFQAAAFRLEGEEDGDNHQRFESSIDPYPELLEIDPQSSILTETLRPAHAVSELKHNVITVNEEQKIEEYVLKELKCKLLYGHSQSEIQVHLENASSLLGGNLVFPTKWVDVKKLLSKLGYTNPKHYKVCCSSDHSYLLKQDDLFCSKCTTPRNKCIDYYVLGLNFENWFTSQAKCQELLGHWNEKEEWFNIDSSKDIQLIELWHGSRFRELSYFWDASKFSPLPAHCTHCNGVVSPSIIATATACNDFQVTVRCPHCQEQFVTCQETFQGDPRNQAVIIHMDGFNPHVSSAKYSISSINIAHATMPKCLRADTKNVHVYSFIPSYQLPKDCPHKYDAFLEPLMNELEELYIYGREVIFSASVDSYPANDVCTLRLIPLLFTADMKAHSEVGLVSTSGYMGCRRCEAKAEYINNHCRFGNFLKRYASPARARCAIRNRKHGKAVDSAPNPTQKKALAKKTGVTGESIFYRLFDMCGFDPVYDQVIDAMHAVGINLIRTELNKMLRPMEGNEKCQIHVRDPKVGGVLSKDTLRTVLKQVNWTCELKDGRVPYVYESGKQVLAYWKADECIKFALVAPCILREHVPRSVYDCFCLVSEIRNLVFSNDLRINGWNQKHIEFLKKLLWKHAITYENVYGKEACSENLENSLHMVDDIARHSTLDNYWCFAYERTALFHKAQTTNQKQLCKTLADRVHQLQFIENYFATHSIVVNNEQQNDQFMNLLSQSPVLLHSSSIKDGFLLKDFLSANQSILSCAVSHCYRNGILIGKCEQHKLSVNQRRDLCFWISKQGVTNELIPGIVPCYKKLIKCDDFDVALVFRVGEHVALEDPDNAGFEWILKIEKFLLFGPFKGVYFTFLDGQYYKALANQYDNWTGQAKLIPHKYVVNCVQPTLLIKRKVILFPVPALKPNFHLTISTEPIINEDKIVHIQLPSSSKNVKCKVEVVDYTTIKKPKVSQEVDCNIMVCNSNTLPKDRKRKATCTALDSVKKPCTATTITARKRELTEVSVTNNPTNKSNATSGSTNRDASVSSRHKWYPVDEQWQRDTCAILGLNFITHNRTTPGGPDVKLGIPDQTKRIQPDGNCMFRALSYVITGSEDQHFKLRTIIVQYMPSISDELYGQTFIDRNNHPTVRDYIHANRTDQDGMWGQDVELFTLSHLLETTVYSFVANDMGRNLWSRFNLYEIAVHRTGIRTNKAMYLYFTGNHYEAVLSVKNSSDANVV